MLIRMQRAGVNNKTNGDEQLSNGTAISNHLLLAHSVWSRVPKASLTALIHRCFLESDYLDGVAVTRPDKQAPTRLWPAEGSLKVKITHTRDTVFSSKIEELAKG